MRQKQTPQCGNPAGVASRRRPRATERPIEPVFRGAIGATVDSMMAMVWEEWAEMSLTHRDVHDPDVAALLEFLQREAELRREARPGTTLAE
jgi:hypothetical protein